MADETVKYVLKVDDKGSPTIIKFGDNAKAAGKKAEKGFNDAGKAVRDFGDEIPGVSGAMQKMAAGPAVMAGAAVAALGVGFASMVKKSIDFADNMNDLSLRLGISTERLSVLSLYAEQSGTDIDTLATAMGKLGVKISEGDKGLKRWGITAGTSDEALFQLADRIAATEDPMLRLKIATDAFGKSGQNMLPLLVQGGAALREMSSNAPIVSSEMAKMADALNDRFAEMRGQAMGIGLGIAEHIIPQIDKWLDGVDKIRRAMGLLNKAEQKDVERRAIIAKYGDKMDANRAAGMAGAPAWLLQKVGANKIDGKTLQQALGEIDKKYELPASGASGAGRFGSGGAAASAKKDGAISAIEDQLYNDRIARAHELDKRRSAESRFSAGASPSLAASMQGVGVAGGAGYASIYATTASEEDRAKATASYKQFLDETVTLSEASALRIEQSIAQMAQGASSVLSGSFMQANEGIDAVFQSIADGFANMIAQMVAELAANAAILAILNIVAPGSGAVMSGGLGGLSGLVIGRATGGPLPGSGAVVYNERREEAIIQRGPARVEPTSGTGNTYVFQVQNPAQASSLRRQIESEERLGTRGIRR